MTNTATAYRTITPNAYGGGAIYRDHYPFGTTRDDAYAVAARIPGAYVEVSANGVTGWTDDAPRDDAAERALSAAYHAARVAEAEARVSAARRAVAAAERAAIGTYAGSTEWHAMGTADDELRDAEHALSTARLARARAERAADERAADDARRAVDAAEAEADDAAAAAAAALSAYAAEATPRAPRRYTARRIAARFYEYTVDGLTPSSDPDTFNVDAVPYAVEDDVMTFDSVADMVAAIRRDGVSFAAYGDGVTASDPDGSQIIDYATGAREAVSWHFDGIAPALIERVIAPAIEAR